jgi:hypothetical protein
MKTWNINRVGIHEKRQPYSGWKSKLMNILWYKISCFLFNTDADHYAKNFWPTGLCLVLATIYYCLRLETSLFVASYDSRGHGGGIRPHRHTGVTRLLPRLVKVKVTLRLTVSQSVLVPSPHLGFMTRYVLLFDSYGLVIVGRPLWRKYRSDFFQSHCLQ